MRKENLVSDKVSGLNGRITRSRAAALLTSGKLQPLSSSNHLDQKQVFKANAKRTALGQNNSSAPDDACLKPKKRPALQDVTNVRCGSSRSSCFPSTKIEPRNTKKAKKSVSSVSKAVTAELQHPQPEIDISEKLKGEEASYSVKLMTADDPDFINIDSDFTDPQLCSLYAPDLYNNLRVAELARRTVPNFMETIQRDISHSMRGILVDWLVEVSEEYKLVPDTLYLTVYLIDWFLSENYIERQRLQLLGITCMLIASKYEEIFAPRVEEFCFITDNTYAKEEVVKMETQVLKYFGFQVFAPTAKTFLRRFLRAAQASYKSPSLELEFLANYLAELTLVEYDFLNILPSTIAASAVLLARWTLDQSCHPWNPTLEHYTSYKAPDLKRTVLALQNLQLNIEGCPLMAIRSKYRQEKYKSVASLSSSKLAETLF